MKNKKITANYVFFGFIAVFVTWLFHEFAHWLSSELFGYETVMTLNSTYSPDEKYVIWHSMVISAMGPAATMLQALIVFIFFKFKYWNKYLFLFLFTPFYMRFLAGFMNFINLNDEGRISNYLELGTFTLPLVISGFLLYLVFAVSRKYKLRRKFLISTLLVVMVFSSILILGDQFLGIRIL